MSKKLIIGIVVGVVVIVGGGATYLLTQKKDSQNNVSSKQGNQSENVQQAEQVDTSSGNIFSLASSGKAQKCTFAYSGNNGTGSGSMYSDGNGRGLMKMSINTEQGNTGESNTLVLNDKVYGWTVANGQSVGFVYDKATLTQNSESSATPEGSTASDPNQSFDLKCESWEIDASVLTVPSNITFNSMPTVGN